MNLILCLLATAVVLLVSLPMLKASFTFAPRPLHLAVNAATNLISADGTLSLIPTAAHAAGVLVKWGADAQHYAVCGVNDMPLGVVLTEVLSTDDLTRRQTVCLLGSYRGGLPFICSEAIVITDELFTAASGGVQNLPAGAGTYYKVGRPVAVGVSGYPVPGQHCYPVKVIVP